MDRSIPKSNSLVAQAVGGSSDALADLLEKVGPVVRREIGPRIPARWRSELSEDDVMQQTYADALRMLSAEKRGGNRKRVGCAPTADSYNELLCALSDTGTSPSARVARREGATATRSGCRSPRL